ncbi:MAG: hypothetical protein CVV21_08260 [Candidatus Goldiibacteriota bacterium HGW-Goldbacteria-1]|jgi:alpha-tubulin suppressor-like RCC1 family protein|nr:MAG: hypothetical protein CVV21_08260 [Candidatus Goldiibacteriota bacterium HGW-Goldbacteria-1]
MKKIMLSAAVLFIFCSVYAGADEINNIIKVSAGWDTSYVLLDNGSVWAAGEKGIIGSESAEDSTAFKNILNGIKDVTGFGDSFLAIKEDSSLLVYGLNDNGQLGISEKNIVYEPEPVMQDVVSASGGWYHSMVIKTDSTLWGAGYNKNGELGINRGKYSGDISQYTEIFKDVKQVSCGGNHTLILKNDGSLWGAGSNNYGCLGKKNIIKTDKPVRIMDGVKFIACGFGSSYVVKDNNTLWACGNNRYGQLGTGDYENRDFFVKVKDDVKTVSAGYGHTLVITNDSFLWAAGSNQNGELGLPDNKAVNIFEKTLDNTSLITCGFNHSLAVKSDGSLWVSGKNIKGQLGTGDNKECSSWKMIKPLSAEAEK